MKRNGSTQPITAWSNEFKGMVFENDFALKGNGIIPMTSGGKRKNIKKKTINNGWVIANNSRKKFGSNIRRNIKPQSLAEMLAFARPSTQAGKNMKGFFKNRGSPKVYKLSNGFLRRQISQGKLQTTNKPSLNTVKSTVTVKQSQITLSPKYKDYYNQNQKRGSTNVIEVESPVDNITGTSAVSNTLAKTSKQPTVNAFKNTQG